MTLIESALKHIYEHLYIQPDWIVLVSADGLHLGSYNCELDVARIGIENIILHNWGRDINRHQKLGDLLEFAVWASTHGYTILIVLNAGEILGLKFTGKVSFSELSILEKGLPAVLKPLVEMLNMDY